MIRVISSVDNELWGLLSTGFQAADAEHQCVGNWSDNDWQETGDVRVILVRRAVYAVAQAIRDGLSVKEAEEQWLYKTKAILNGQRLNRRFNKLALLDDAAASPADFSIKLQHHGIEFEPTNPQEVVKDVALLAAQASISKNADLLELDKKLVINALPVIHALDDLPVDVILEDILLIGRAKSSSREKTRQLESDLIDTQRELEITLIGRKQAQHDLIDVTVERNTFRAEAANLAKQLTSERSNAQKQNSELATVKTELEKLRADSAASEAELQTFKEESELLLVDLEKARAMKEKWNETRASINAELSELKSKIAHKDEKLHEMSRKRKQEQLLYSRELSDLKSKVSELRLKQTQIEKDLEALKRENAGLGAQLASANEKNLEQTEKLNAKNEKLHDFSLKRKQALEQAEKLAAKLEQKDEKLRWFSKKLSSERAARAEAVEKLEAELKLTRVQLRTLQERAQLPVVKPRTMRDYLSKIARIGRAKQRDSQVKKARELKQIDFIRQSQWFDPVWYVRKYPDVLEAEIEPAEHYYYFGGFEGRDPGPDFGSRYYIENNDDVAEQKINPLVHYIVYGREEGRLIKPALLEHADKAGAKYGTAGTQ